MKTSEILVKAKALIVDPVNWTQGDWFGGPDRKCMCSLGAIAQVMFGASFDDMSEGHEVVVSPAVAALEDAVPGFADEFGSQSFAAFNDRKTHAEVMGVFDQAIINTTEKEKQQQ